MTAFKGASFNKFPVFVTCVEDISQNGNPQIEVPYHSCMINLPTFG